MFKASRRLQKLGVLGMNPRNAEYIMAHNPRSAFPLVDDKYQTKQLAEAYRIPIPPLYHVIGFHGEVAGLERVLAPHPEFVIKPARGSGGSGIILITGQEHLRFFKPSAELVTLSDLKSHIFNILSGIYSLEGREDRVLIEALIHPHPALLPVSYQGIPDIRLVVYRGVPVMGMLRLPTKESDGKANIHRGAVGVGIRLSDGKTSTAIHESRPITHHPDTGSVLGGITIPFWEETLRISALSFEMTGLGYLGADMVIDREQGPLLLELNARPGLQIQMANQRGLRGRLELVDQVPAKTLSRPEMRIEWAAQAFEE